MGEGDGLSDRGKARGKHMRREGGDGGQEEREDGCLL